MASGLKRLGLFLGLSTIFLNGCDGFFLEDQQSLTESSLVVDVATVQNPMTYMKRRGLETGLEHDILSHFAQEMGYRLKWHVFKSETAAIESVVHGKNDILAIRSPIHLQDSSNLLPTPAYDSQDTILTCRVDVNVETSMLGKLAPENKLSVLMPDKILSSEQKSRFRQIYPQVDLTEIENIGTLELLKMVQTSKADCALSDAFETQYHIRFFNKLTPVTEIADLSYHFFVNGKERQLHSALRFWFKKSARKGNLGRYKNHYITHLEELNLWEQFFFYRNVQQKLPSYKREFLKAARAHHLPWQMVAAVAFQESQWNPDAVSYTGVRGLMQLTLPTAQKLGVLDRTDPKQSIWGGAKYLRYLFNKQPKHLPDRERWALALASYNLGYAHVLDAQRLALRRGKNPYLWSDLRKVLPELENPSVANTLKYGQARGNEGVSFVTRVFAYYELLTIPYYN